MNILNKVKLVNITNKVNLENILNKVNRMNILNKVNLVNIINKVNLVKLSYTYVLHGSHIADMPDLFSDHPQFLKVDKPVDLGIVTEVDKG